MNVLMIGVDRTSLGGMLTVVENYLNNEKYCAATNVQYIATVINSNKLLKIIVFLRVLPIIIWKIKKDKIDILHVHMGERGSVFREGFVVWIAHLLGVKTIIHMHGATIEDWYNRQKGIIKGISKRIFRKADNILILGEFLFPFMKEVVGKAYEDRIKVLYNAVHVEEVNNYNCDATNLLFYGVLVKRKGIDVLLEAYKSILDEIPKDIHLTLYGADFEHNIHEKISKYELWDRVSYCGWMTNENSRQCFEKTMVNILPSYNEGLPMTILETMGYGIPNISTNIAAIPEVIINDVNGYLVNPGNVLELANAMRKIINERETRERFSQEAHKMAKDKFSLDSHIEYLLQLYHECVYH